MIKSISKSLKAALSESINSCEISSFVSVDSFESLTLEANSQAAFSRAIAHSPSKEFSCLISRSEDTASKSLPTLEVS